MVISHRVSLVKKKKKKNTLKGFALSTYDPRVSLIAV